MQQQLDTDAVLLEWLSAHAAASRAQASSTNLPVAHTWPALLTSWRRLRCMEPQRLAALLLQWMAKRQQQFLHSGADDGCIASVEALLADGQGLAASYTSCCHMPRPSCCCVPALRGACPCCTSC